MPGMSIRQAQHRLRQIKSAVQRERLLVAQKAMNKGLQDAQRLSSGPYSLAELRRRDHPYARRHGSPLLTPWIINLQSGAFRREWRVEGPMTTLEAVRVSLVNASPVADYLQHGTTKMFARPVGLVLHRLVHGHAVLEAERAARRLEQRYG